MTCTLQGYYRYPKEAADESAALRPVVETEVMQSAVH